MPNTFTGTQRRVIEDLASSYWDTFVSALGPEVSTDLAERARTKYINDIVAGLEDSSIWG